MEDELLTQADEQAGLSAAYVQAVAVQAGYTCHEPSGPDRDSIDLQISSGGAMRPKLDLQLKSRVELARKGDAFRYPLKVKNYDDLRVATQTPRLLVVLDLPKSPKEWLLVSREQLILRRAAYWVDLRGSAPTENSESVTVSIPAANLFDPPALKALMERSRHGWPREMEGMRT